MRLNSLGYSEPVASRQRDVQNDQVRVCIGRAADTCKRIICDIGFIACRFHPDRKRPRYIHIIFNDQHFSRPGLAVFEDRGLKTGSCGIRTFPILQGESNDAQ